MRRRFVPGSAPGTSLASDLLFIACHPSLVTLSITPEDDVPIVIIEVVDAQGRKTAGSGPLAAVVPAFAAEMQSGVFS